MPERIQKTHCKPSLSVVLMYHELSDPTYNFVLICPAVSERFSGKAAVDGNPHVKAGGVTR